MVLQCFFTVYDTTLFFILLNSVNSAIGHVRKIRRRAGHFLSRSSKNKAAHSKGGQTTKSLISGPLASLICISSFHLYLRTKTCFMVF